MAKVDFTKSEQLLNDGLLKMSIRQLLQLADKVNSFGRPFDPNALPSIQARSILLTFMENDLEKMSKVEDKIYTQVGIRKKDLRNIIEKANYLTQDDWVKLKAIRTRVIQYKKDLAEKIPHLSDDEIVVLERKKHLNKRFNVREKWLPLK